MTQVYLYPGADLYRRIHEDKPRRQAMPSVSDLEHRERAHYRSAVAGRSKRADKLLRRFSWEERE